MPETWTKQRHDGIMLMVALVLVLVGAVYIWHEDHECSGELAGQPYYDHSREEWRPHHPNCG